MLNCNETTKMMVRIQLLYTKRIENLDLDSEWLVCVFFFINMYVLIYKRAKD